MRSPRPKVHLKDSDVPLTEGADYQALCGKRVPEVEFRFMWDAGELGLPQLNVFQCCKECWRILETTELEGSLVYGLVSAEEVLHQELEGLSELQWRQEP